MFYFLLRGTIVNRTNGTHKQLRIFFTYFYYCNNVWSYLLWSPVILIVGLVPCYPVRRPIPTFAHRGFPSTPSCGPPSLHPLGRASITPPVASTPCIPLDTTHGGCAALPARLLVPLHHEPFRCFEDPPVPLPRLCCCSVPQRGINPKHGGGVFRWLLGGSGLPKVF